MLQEQFHIIPDKSENHTQPVFKIKEGTERTSKMQQQWRGDLTNHSQNHKDHSSNIQENETYLVLLPHHACTLN